MTAAAERLQAQYGPRLNSLLTSLAAADDARFVRELDELVRIREHDSSYGGDTFVELRRLTHHLQSALERFQLDSRLIDMAENDVPDVRHRLDHVLRLTSEAAHRTLDLVEQSGPAADRACKEAGELEVLWQRFRDGALAAADLTVLHERMQLFLKTTCRDMNGLHANLNEVLLAQGYQDLTGQIIRGVMNLIAELEVALANLVKLSSTAKPVEVAPLELGDRVRAHGSGPAVPGIDEGVVVSGQQDVDALLSGLGV